MTTSTRPAPTTSTEPLIGSSIIAGHRVAGTNGSTHGVNPANGESLEPQYSLLSEDQVSAAVEEAERAFSSFRTVDPHRRASFLDDIASNIESDADRIIERASLETGLTTARLRGEVARTAGQLRLFAEVVRRGEANGVRIDPALPDRTPLPRPDIRQRRVPLGPVAVFGASNFPLAFSTAGGDTASALAAGCPVIVKAHNAHPGTNELVGQAITRAVADNDLHPGVFSLVYGAGAKVGQQLAADERIKAVGFTGSRQAGLALTSTAVSRAVPIPVYAEMSSINPVFVLPGAIETETAEVAAGFFGAVTGSSGQLCTSPGLMFVPEGPRGDALVADIVEAFTSASGQTMLSAGISRAWQDGVDHLTAQPGVTVLAQGTPGNSDNAPGPVVVSASFADFISNPELQAEIFGSAAVIVRYASTEQLVPAVRELEGQLTATLQLTESDHQLAADLIHELELRAGRIIINGWPTGVDVGHAMIHGGPFPATSDSRSTSVGATAIDRFLRPVAYQNLPDGLLPPALRDSNPLALSRVVDGEVTIAEAGASAESSVDAASGAGAESFSAQVRARLGDLGHELPAANPAAYNYQTVTVVGDLAFASGQIAKNGDHLPQQGIIGDDLSVDEGIKAAELCAVNLIAQLDTHVGLDAIERIAKVNVYVASHPDFADHPTVAEGTSKLLVEALGEVGRHSRTALGVPRLPKSSPVEIEAVVKLRS